MYDVCISRVQLVEPTDRVHCTLYNQNTISIMLFESFGVCVDKEDLIESIITIKINCR